MEDMIQLHQKWWKQRSDCKIIWEQVAVKPMALYALTY
jgi:hypothetical protein